MAGKRRACRLPGGKVILGAPADHPVVQVCHLCLHRRDACATGLFLVVSTFLCEIFQEWQSQASSANGVAFPLQFHF